MATNRLMTIGKEQIMVEDTELNQSDLLFFPENPRVFTALHTIDNDNPTQQDIEKHMCGLDPVKTLKTSIEANGGLLNAIIVKDNIVLEGNSRLAAYRLLAKNDKIKWAKIKCTVLPSDISEELVFNLLGTIHIIGQTPWSAFEQAGYLYRTKMKSRRPIDAIATDLGMKTSEAKTYILVYEKMLEKDDIKPTKWSYYYELLKNRSIIKADAENPDIEIIDNVIELIKDDKIYEAKDIRKIADIVKSKNDDALEVFQNYINGDIELDDAKDLVIDVNNTESVKKGFDKFLKLLCDSNKYIKELTKNDADFNLRIQQIQDTLNTLSKVK